LGAGTLKDLALALLVGILSGTYSSIFVATPILSMLKEREPKYRNVREKVLRDAKRTSVAPAAAVAVGASDGAEASAPRGSAPATTMPRRSGPARPSSKSRAGSKKAKRRKKR
jgi:preprotein translocase subunit SecF